MSKVSVTGTKSVIRDVIEVSYDQNVVHLSDYDGGLDGLRTGSPLDGAEEASDQLVTVRSLISILDVTEDETGPAEHINSDGADEDELRERYRLVRREVNELDERREEIESRIAEIDERLKTVEPFVNLDIDLDLLTGYDSLDVAVGEADDDAVRRALAEADRVKAHEVYSSGNVVVALAYPEGDVWDDEVFEQERALVPASNTDGLIDEALSNVQFLTIEVPDADGSPGDYREELVHERRTLESKLSSVRDELDTVRLEHGSFLLAVEEMLHIEVQKTEAPLRFATTEHAFFAEGWIPADRYSEFENALNQAVGDRVAVDELERAEHERHRAAPDGQTLAADGGAVSEQPPVLQDNPWFVKPYETFVRAISRPNYFDFDPTIVLFLTFPIMFGFMIADVGYGLVYLLAGYGMWRYFDDRPGIRNLGGIGMWSAVVTIIFGFIYGEIFGFHIITDVVWGGTPPLEKGLSPATIEFAELWLVISVIAGLFHVSLGYVMGFIEEFESHGPRAAILEKGSWFLLMNGIWIAIFSDVMKGITPEFAFTVLNGEPLGLGFSGFSVTTGYAALAVAAVGLLLLVYHEYEVLGGAGLVTGLLESLQSLVNVLSYTRLAAEIIAEAGIAFVINLLVFGAYRHEGHLNLLVGHAHAPDGAHLMFPGLVNSGIIGIIGGILVLILGHLLVLALGITSAALQALRLEYVEYFNKFYDGGGTKYEPFGYDRSYTTKTD